MILSVTSKKHYEPNQPADEPRPNPYHLLPGKNIFSVKSKQRILDQMGNYLHCTGPFLGDKEGPGERGAVLQGGVRLFRLEQERHHSHQVGKHQCH